MVCNLLRNVPGVIRILSNNDGPQEIYANEIKIISILTADSEIIESSNICVEGGKVVVVDGPLLGLDGYIKAIDKRKGRVKVVLNLMGEPRTVELSVALLQPA
jgi:transcriptional antiterminator NusG